MEAANAQNQEEHSNSSLRNGGEQKFCQSDKLTVSSMLQSVVWQGNRVTLAVCIVRPYERYQFGDSSVAVLQHEGSCSLDSLGGNVAAACLAIHSPIYLPLPFKRGMRRARPIVNCNRRFRQFEPIEFIRRTSGITLRARET